MTASLRFRLIQFLTPRSTVGLWVDVRLMKLRPPEFYDYSSNCYGVMHICYRQIDDIDVSVVCQTTITIKSLPNMSHYVKCIKWQPVTVKTITNEFVSRLDKTMSSVFPQRLNSTSQYRSVDVRTGCWRRVWRVDFRLLKTNASGGIEQTNMCGNRSICSADVRSFTVNRQASQVIVVWPGLSSWYAAKGKVDVSCCRGRLRKSWKDNIKEWTD